MDVEQFILSYFASHVKATREELIAWAVSYNFSKIQAGDAILDLSIDAKIHWQYDHWVKDASVEAPAVPEKIPAPVPVPVVETRVITRETVSVTQTTVSVQKTTQFAITLEEVVKEYLDDVKPHIKPVPSVVKAWIEKKYHQSFMRERVSLAISNLYREVKPVTRVVPVAIPTPKFFIEEKRGKSQERVDRVLAGLERQGIKCISRETIHQFWKWQCQARHVFHRALPTMERDPNCPECLRIEIENNRKISKWQQQQKGMHVVRCESCGYVWKTDSTSQIINCPSCYKRVANDVVQKPVPLPETPKQVEYPNSADGLLRKLKAEKDKR